MRQYVSYGTGSPAMSYKPGKPLTRPGAPTALSVTPQPAMYANNNPWGSQKASEPAFSVNNPFVEGTAADRFPAIEPPSSQQQPLQQLLPYPTQLLPSAPPPQQLQQRQILYGASSQQSVGWDSRSGPQQQAAYSSSAISGHVVSQQPQPSGYAGFVQQYDQLNPYVGQQNWFPQYQQAPTYTQPYQQGVLNEFDPYGQGGSVSGQPVSSNMPRLGPSGQQHPRQYIQTHKVELELWSEFAWKQAFSTFEELKRAWEGRRADIQRQILTGRYLSSEEVAHLNSLTRDAESNIDSVVASLAQIQEVHRGYKQSLDIASRGRVKEALNAGLRGLPEWP